MNNYGALLDLFSPRPAAFVDERKASCFGFAAYLNCDEI